MKEKKLITCVFLGLAMLAVSCSITKPYQSPAMESQQTYRGQLSTDTTNMAALHWTEIFRDDLLRDLIQEGIDSNLNLKIAYSRIRQAQSYFEQSRLASLPALTADLSTLNGTQSNAKNPGSSSTTALYQLNLSAGWEADLWGKLRSS